MTAFPVRIVQLDPANLGTADAAAFGEGDNGLEYCIKTLAKTPRAPAAELVCHRLAEECNLPVPQFDVVTMPDGTYAFGSVWDASALVDKQSTLQLLTGMLTGRQIAKSLARIYAFDLFVHNDDRHMGNFLCVAGRTPGHSIKLYDFSRALTFHGWPLPALPMPPATKTMVIARILRTFHPFDLGEALQLLDRIEGIAFSSFRDIVRQVPAKWLATATRGAMTKWWTSGRIDRLKAIREGLKNGSYL